MKKIIKNNIKVIIAFILGMLMSGITVYGVTLNFASDDVEHTKSDGSKTTVSAAINELYGKSVTPTKVTGNAYTGASGYLNGSSSLTTSTDLTLANYKSSNQYAFKLGSKEQLTLPAGYYSLPINVASGISSIDTSIAKVQVQLETHHAYAGFYDTYFHLYFIDKDGNSNQVYVVRVGKVGSQGNSTSFNNVYELSNY